MHSGLHVCMHIYSVCALFACPGIAGNEAWIACLYAYLQCLRSFCLSWKSLECIVYCMFVCIFTVFALFLLVLEELGMHSGLHVCMHIYGVCALCACPGRAWNA